MRDLFETFARCLGGVAPQPNVCLTMTCFLEVIFLPQFVIFDKRMNASPKSRVACQTDGIQVCSTQLWEPNRERGGRHGTTCLGFELQMNGRWAIRHFPSVGGRRHFGREKSNSTLVGWTGWFQWRCCGCTNPLGAKGLNVFAYRFNDFAISREHGPVCKVEGEIAILMAQRGQMFWSSLKSLKGERFGLCPA